MREWSFDGIETIVAWRETTQYWTRGDEGLSLYQMAYKSLITDALFLGYIHVNIYSYFMFRYFMLHRVYKFTYVYA